METRPVWPGRVDRQAARRRPLALEPLEDRFLLSVYTVDRLTDYNQGSGLTGDLRYCITQATDGDTITFGVTGAIHLIHDLPALTHSIDIAGPGANLVAVHGGEGVFRVAAGSTVTISGLTITGGHGYGVSGGGVHNDGTLALVACTISGNIVENGGAGTVYGGGIYNDGTLLLRNSTVANNIVYAPDLAVGYGGGIYNAGTLTVLESTIANNQNSSGGYGMSGGGIASGGTLTVRNSTISGNWASSYGGGIYVGSSSLDMRDSIVALNGAANGPDLYGQLTSSGYNLIGNTKGGSGFSDTDLLDVDPLLGPLADNGGRTQTMALLPGSPAIDAGDNTGAPRWDQRGRGYHRIVNGTIDIGAYEVQPSPAIGPFRDAPADGAGTGLPARSAAAGQPPDPGAVEAGLPDRQAGQEPSTSRPVQSEAMSALVPVAPARHAQDAVFEGLGDPLADVRAGS